MKNRFSNIQYAIFSLLAIICSNYFIFSVSSTNDAFYMFQVGQGNSQFVRYDINGKNIGILYDAGSSSGMKHNKFCFNKNLQKIFEDCEISTYKNTKQASSSDSSDSERKPTPKLGDIAKGAKRAREDSEQPSSHPNKRESMGGEGSRYTATSQQTTYTDYIRNTLIEVKLNHLFVILSHPDKDHINFISQNILPANVPKTFFLGGAWLGDAASNSQEDDLATDVQKVFSYINGRENIHFELPYYWNQSNYLALKKRIKQQDYKNLYNEFSKWGHTGLDSPVDERSATLQELVQEICSYYNTNAVQQHFQIFEDTEIQAKFLRNVIFWSLNHHTSNANDQSMVVSCTNDNLNMSFVFTGDAEDTSFEKIILREKSWCKDPKDILRKYLKIVDPMHLVFLMFAHHGSHENISAKKLHLFMPDAIGISAGNGGQYKHPSKHTRRHIVRNQKTLKVQQASKVVGEANQEAFRFWQRFEYVEQQKRHYSAFFDNNVLALRTEIKHHNLPIFCTNIDGSLKIIHDAIYSQPGERYIMVNNVEYKINFLQHIAHAIGAYNKTSIMFSSNNSDIVINTQHPLYNEIIQKISFEKISYENQEYFLSPLPHSYGLYPIKNLNPKKDPKAKKNIQPNVCFYLMSALQNETTADSSSSPTKKVKKDQVMT